MGIYADLHMHTFCSDGTLSPREIVDEGISNGLKAIAITDHDCVDAIDTAIKHADGKLQIVPSIELSCIYQKQDIHILGHFIDHKNSILLKEIEAFKKSRFNRAEEMAFNLKNKMGIEIDFKKIKNQSDSGTLGRPHIAKALIEVGACETMQEAFENLLYPGSPIYVPKFELSPKRAFELVLNAGGIPVWAHPYYNKNDDFLKVFITEGLKGIEVYHPSHPDNIRDRYYNLAVRNKLVISGGSDFHSFDSNRAVGSLGINKQEFDELQKLAETR